eukprot:4330183-Ditylum_brightwellii.AAC.1
MVHPCKQMLVDVGDNNIGCLTPHGKSAGTEGIIFVKSTDAKDDDDGVDKCVDDCIDGCVGGHVDYCVGKENGVEDSVDGGGKHLTHFTQVVDCFLKLRKEQNACGPNATKSRNVLYHSVKSTDAKEDDECVDGCIDGFVYNCFNRSVDSHVDCCVDDGKEDGVVDSVDGGDNHLTYLTHFE